METPEPKSNFIREIIDADLAAGKNEKRVHTRFPPEPNGYLHIGHAKSICLNSGLARDYKGKFNLRFDDTNPSKEEQEYVDSIIEDVKWLGGDFEDRLLFASDYFQQMYDWAMKLVKDGKAYVCDLNAEEVRKHRGTPSEPGKDSPFRGRSIEENADLFERMKNGEFPDGSRTLRAKIDMAHPNLNLRDPVMYRILHAEHHRQGNKWCVYPMYDWAHGLEDSIEKITHSICTLEFADHRPLYDWFLDALGVYHPQQLEFARLNLSNTVLSKRKLLELVRDNHVSGWDDPRMPTISGIRRRGFRAAALRQFAREVRLALPNSLRVASNATHYYIEFILTTSGGRYRDPSDGSTGGSFLSFSSTTDVAFDALGPNPAIAAGDFIVVYNLGPDYAPADAYTTPSPGGNRAQVSSVAGNTVTLATNPFAAAAPPLPSPSSRFHVVPSAVKAVTYECPRSIPGDVTRYWNYGFNASAPPPAPGGSSAIAISNATCEVSYSQNVSFRNALLSIKLTVTDATTSGESVTLFQQIHMDNSP